MAFNNNNKIHQHLKVVPPSSSSSSQTTITIPLTSYDLLFLRSRPVERIFFYTLINSQSHPSFFFQNIVPTLNSSLSLTLQHFLPIAGKIVWPSDSSKPFIRFNPNDNDTGVSLLIAESNADFDHVISNSPHEASLSRSFIPDLESSDSFASIISLQITFFPNSGFGIGITSHHAVFDGKSSSMFMKAWAYICNKIIQSETPTLLPELEPSFNREIIDDKNGDDSIERINKLFQTETVNQRSLKIFPFETKLVDSVRATFKLTREDLDIIKQNVLSKWEISDTNESKPHTLSSFVLTCAHSVVSIAKAMHGVEKEREKFSFAFAVDCRARLEPQVPNNYFGNCVRGAFMDTKPFDFKEEDSVFVVAKRMHEKIKMIKEKGLEGNILDVYDKYNSLNNEGCETIGIAGSNRFGVYETDFGFGRPKKVEIVSIDGGLAIGLSESKDGNGGVEVGLVRNRHVMDLFSILFHGFQHCNKPASLLATC
ncbi:malonyl-CoA:anthocyanidin 5-O-glucoside-6''-O-malonyltransferase-like [Vicia villosa]|uniref:malonyl-CoA:anthocyanidin 5-O-glucoside-6''-O-malonyltransferase-like n=1 Tax=Vicia villosa TaxID=3911 RepID=UPI00273C92C9|nr:malonyl-CoA:anthocyanidin 5-O-glucoside-6''-O-malonyltransferase-like [Vicia villosa]